ncbi:MAG: S8 family serine peptidase [Bacteroidales bacterium]|jgi:subtilisin family serine protease|nr:S8 family serine peptidase [Bacteroidales bacterium]
MYTYTLGGKNGKKYVLHESTDMVAVRLIEKADNHKAVISEKSRELLKDFELVEEFPEAGISVFQARESVEDPRALRDRTKSELRKEPDMRFAGKVLIDAESKTLVLYTCNLFIKFRDDLEIEKCEGILADNDLTVKKKPDYAPNTYFAKAPDDIGVRIFNLAERLLLIDEVEFCHPELIRKRSYRKINPRQWHLKETAIKNVKISAGVKADLAHKLSKGNGVTIAIIDDGVDIFHPEFREEGKVVYPRDVVKGNENPLPAFHYDNHGTACAGIAAASGIKASGVAPKAFLMPVRLSSNLGSMAEADAFKWAADHGADIISCSWGPADGNWSDPDDPVHFAPVGLPDSTRLAIDYAISSGRGGKGCIITFAAGNGNEDSGYDGYASYEKVIAVSACNDTGSRCVYSDYGKNVWCAFPSSDFGYAPFKHPAPLTEGIYTTDRQGSEGYNPEGDYTGNFGGTSASCPGVAGTAALILAANPALSWIQVKDILRDTAERIDTQNGSYDESGHSIYYGFGRVNAEKAVKGAIELKTPGKYVRRKKTSEPARS